MNNNCHDKFNFIYIIRECRASIILFYYNVCTRGIAHVSAHPEVLTFKMYDLIIFSVDKKFLALAMGPAFFKEISEKTCGQS